ncbi:formate dehydrogenase accessory sulfurtransferase FdhD [Vibrio sp.]|nr:formate dehydrogenase accessory sulfurtransferase FdhD [Vibrio sp.]
MKPSHSSHPFYEVPSTTSKERACDAVINQPLVEEIPLALSYNGINYAVMMVTPVDLEAFVLGFSLSEKIVDHATELKSVTFHSQEEGIEASIDISNRAFYALKQQRRQLAGRTGCGICGKEALEHLSLRDLNILPQTPLPESHLFKGLRNTLSEHQPLAQISGALHSAAFINDKGDIVMNYEDVGRHNALDKLIGGLLQKKQDMSSGAIVMTSRCSFELVQKVIRCGGRTLATLSPPTAKAVEMARLYNLNLLHLTYQGAVRVYACPTHLNGAISSENG